MHPPANAPRNIHAQVEELLPFFVAGTLGGQEAEFVRQHLSGCSHCKQSLTEWFEIAHMVRTEAASWSAKLPPLSPQVQARLRANGKKSKLLMARFDRVSITLVAALLTVVFIGGLLLNNRDRDDSTMVAVAPTHTETVLPPSFTPIATTTAAPAASSTPTLSIPTLDPAIAPVVPIVPTEPRPSVTAVATTARLPITNTPAPERLMPTATDIGMLIAPVQPQPTSTPIIGCEAVAFQPGDLYLYAGPGSTYDVLWLVRSEVTLRVNARSDNGWYLVGFQMGDALREGWISGSTVYLLGQYCAVLPILPPVPGATPSMQVESAGGEMTP